MDMGNAINIQFSWLCSSNHKHSVSIDLAILIKTSSLIQEYFSPVRFDLKGTPFEDLIDINEKMYWNCSLFSGRGRASTNIFDKQMLEICDEISPNIRLCYRFLKFIHGCFLPGDIVRRFCHLARDSVSYLKNGVSSYSLKQALIQEVIEFPSSDHWKNGFIHLRIVSILQKLLKHKLRLDDLFDERTKGKLSCYVSDAFIPILTNMMQWLYNGCERISLLQRSMLSMYNEGITILLENKILVSVSKRVLHTHVFSDSPLLLILSCVSRSNHFSFRTKF